MQVYNFHPETGEFLCEEAAHPNQLEPGNWLVPAFATTVQPPAPLAGHARVFQFDYWRYVEDHRGKVFWRGDRQVVIVRLGAVPPGLSVDKPRRSLFEFAGRLRAAFSFVGI
jgi:hypothetical protein